MTDNQKRTTVGEFNTLVRDMGLDQEQSQLLMKRASLATSKVEGDFLNETQQEFFDHLQFIKDNWQKGASDNTKQGTIADWLNAVNPMPVDLMIPTQAAADRKPISVITGRYGPGAMVYYLRTAIRYCSTY